MDRMDATAEETALVLINLSTAPASYDPACLEGAELLLSTTGADTRGALQPLEAAVYVIR